MYCLDIPLQTITVDGLTYSSDVFLSNEFIPDFALRSEFHRLLFDFLKEWFSSCPVLNVYTSGSTGIPKEMQVEKTKMMQSAILTCSFLNLEEKDRALLCMPLKYIAGKMMVVRALVAGLDLCLVTPCGNPLAVFEKSLKFAAMTPMQVFNSLQSDMEKERLFDIDTLIIGGGAIDAQLGAELKNAPKAIYSTYGMTETLSHIALRRMNGVDMSDQYIPFPSVKLSLTPEQTLIIDAPQVSDDVLYTNDIAELYPDSRFTIVGRKDNVINSGGVKIHIEELEALLQPLIKCQYAITSFSDPKFGEVVVLVVDGEVDEYLLAQHISPYSFPKKIIRLATIPYTETGKVSRAMLKKIVADILIKG